jgi:glycosyltransferase involved in cell wall biosynthesis
VESAPTLTIGMLVCDGAKYITEAIESILAQFFRDFELIISDNASTDDSATGVGGGQA